MCATIRFSGVLRSEIMRLGIRRKLIGTLMLVGLLPLALSLAIILRGAVIAGDVKPGKYDQHGEDWWVRAMNGGTGRTFISTVVSNPGNGRPVIALAVPVFDGVGGEPGQRVLGVMKEKIELEWLSKE